MHGPLKLPHGSVRGLLAVLVVFVTCWLMVRGEEVPLAVSESLFTVLAFYFAARAHVMALEAARAQEAAGGGEAPATVHHPFFLPCGTIRLAIVLAFIGVAAYLVKERGLNGLVSSTTLLLVFAFFAGQLVKLAIAWWRRGKPKHATSTFEHVKAAVGVAMGVAFVALYVSGYYKQAPPAAHKLFLAFIIFYFGSR